MRSSSREEERYSWFGFCSWLRSAFSLVLSLALQRHPHELHGSPKALLDENWFIQPSADVHADGAAISTVGFATRGWYPATIPSTVLSALVENKVYPDPYTGMNLRSIPGTTYPVFEDFSNIMMPPTRDAPSHSHLPHQRHARRGTERRDRRMERQSQDG